MRDFTDALAALRVRLDEARQYLRIDELSARRPQLETEAGRPDLWDDPDVGRKVTGELAAVTADLDLYDGLAGQLEDAETLHELAREEEDETQEAEIAEAVAALDKRLAELELRSLFAGRARRARRPVLDPGGRGRGRRPGLGRDAAADVPALGRRPRLRLRGGGPHPGLGGGHRVRRVRRARVGTRTAGSSPSAACTASCA